tara:strand:- start:242 stop:988 length:747 start_codon:yes stop_codon:yes gene_type:complete
MKLPLYFISDNHFLLENNTLEANRRNKLFNLFNYIKKTGGTLIIGGDFFDFWLQSRTGPPNYYNDILEELEQLYLNKITIHYVMGNHDYWDFGFFKKKFGANVYKTDFLLKIGEKKILVTHGDGVLKHDYMYRFMRKIIRSKLFIFFVRLIPISIMTIIAKKISSTKYKFDKKQYLNQKFQDELKSFAFQNMKNNNIDVLLMGHYHQTGIYDNGDKKFIHLGDWINQYTVTILDEKGMWNQKKWDINK